jgi:hypothetical protein
MKTITETIRAIATINPITPKVPKDSVVEATAVL